MSVTRRAASLFFTSSYSNSGTDSATTPAPAWRVMLSGFMREVRMAIADSMFPSKEKSFRIVNMDSECEMSQKNHDFRLLLIRSPILNEKSCYTAACHAHKEEDEVLGSLVIRIPLKELDVNFNKSCLLTVLATLMLATLFVFFTRIKIKNP